MVWTAAHYTAPAFDKLPRDRVVRKGTRSLQRDFYKDSHAPPATRHLGACVALRFSERVLPDHRRDGAWGLFGGALESGENLEVCARREVAEETGLRRLPGR